MILYLLFLVSIFVLSSFLIGPFTGRVWLVMMMCLYLLFEYSRNKRLYNRLKRYYDRQLLYIYIFITYILLLIFAQLLNGDFETLGLKWIFANHFVSIVVLLATFNFTRENTQRRMDIIITTIMVLLIVDSSVTIAQYNNNPLGWAVNIFLTQGRNEEVVNYMSSSLILEDTASGFAKTPGLFNDVVDNAIFLGSFGVLPFYFIQKKNKAVKIFAICILILIFIACYMCQERAAMLTLLASIIFLGYKNMHNKALGVFLAFILFLVLFTNIDFSKFEFGRFQEVGMFSNDAREGIWDKTIPYFSDNWFLGGVDKFRKIAGGSLPHNFFLNAFVFGGFLGGIVIIILLFMILFRIYKDILLKETTCILSTALLSILIQSLVHNMSLITGDVFSFLLLGLMIVSERRAFSIETYLNKKKEYEHNYSVR